MSIVLDGTPASEGIASGKVFLLEWGVPVVPHETVAPDKETSPWQSCFSAVRVEEV